MEVRCCCNPENLIGHLPKGLAFPIRELDDESFAYVADSLPDDILEKAKAHKKGKGRSKSWRKRK